MVEILQGRVVDLAALLVGVGVLLLSTIEGIRTRDLRRDGALPLLALALVLLLILRMGDDDVPLLALAVGIVALIIIAVGFRYLRARPDLETDLEEERCYYEEVLRARLEAERPDCSPASAEGVTAAVEEKLYEELTVVDRKLALTLGTAAAVAAIHGFLVRGIQFPITELNALPWAHGSALGVANLGLMFALAAAFLALWPRAIWLGEERMRLRDQGRDCDGPALLCSLLKQRRLRDRSYRGAKRLTFYSALCLIIAHGAAWVGYAQSVVARMTAGL